MRETYLKEGAVQFDDLWTVFTPGTLINGTPFQKQDQLFIVQDNLAIWPERSEPSADVVALETGLLDIRLDG